MMANLFPINLEDELKPLRSFDPFPWRKITNNPVGRWILRILKQEVPVDWILAGDRDILIGKPDLNKKTLNNL